MSTLSSSVGEPLTLTIFDRQLTLHCPIEQHATLTQAAATVDQLMREHRQFCLTDRLDELAMLAALQLSHQLQQATQQKQSLRQQLSEHITRLQKKIARIIGTEDEITI